MWDPKYDIYKEFAATPDEELVLWENWIQIRKHEVERLGLKTGRVPADLVMHGAEEIRAKKEEKRVLEHAKIKKKPKLRGGQWQQKQRLSQFCPCANVYEVHKTPSELGELKPLVQVHIGCPDYVKQTEKGVIGEPERIQCTKLNADYEKYKAQRKEQLKKNIMKLEPHRPDIKNLVVIGKKPKTRTPVPNVPIITVDNVSDAPCDALCGVYAFRLNNTIFYKEIPKQNCSFLKEMQKEPWHETCKSWSYYFNTPESKIGRAKLFMKNMGTVSLRFCWKRQPITYPFNVQNDPKQVFFFYNGQDVISPGQTKLININFVSTKPGIFMEIWELTFQNINFFHNTQEKLTLQLFGDATENVVKTNKRVEKLQNRIEKKMIRQLAFELMNEAINKATSIEHEYYPYKKYILESEMFIMKNPVCFYHQTEVNHLKELYKEMTQQEWDLSITTWKDALMQMQFEDRMKYYELLKKSYKYLLKPWAEGDEVLLIKYRAVKMLLGDFADTFYDEKMEVSRWNGLPTKHDKSHKDKSVSPVPVGTLTPDIVQNSFYIRMLDHMADTIENIAGIVSSLDLNRWIEFDFCKY